ncbi:MAG TPA: hypothetical protein VFG66_11975 [Gemmatimonadales bacterium]|nr:hypothetical protein [Gemmatimonadales bacterium]
MSDTAQERPGDGGGGETTQETSRRGVEMLIDEIVEDSFPASDPPAWGVAASRLERARQTEQPPE